MSREANLLVACARHFMRRQSSDEIQAALRGNFDWPALLELANVHSVMPLLYWGLQLECPEHVPQELRTRFECHARSNLVQTAELLRVLRLFDQNQIPVIALKGPILAAWAYGDLALRAFMDLDFLIRPHDVVRAKKVLIGNGYRLASSVHSSSANSLLRSKDGELLFERLDAGITLDVHWRLFPDYFPESLDRNEIWQNLGAVELGGHMVPTLSDQNLLLFLAAHGGKHRWSCLGWICDFAVALKRTRIDWERLLWRARRAHIERMLVLGLRLVCDVLGAELPTNVATRVAADSHVADLAAAVQMRLLSDLPADTSAPEACRMNLRMLERFRDKIRFLTGIVITPGEAEWRSMRLPPVAYHLYYPYRLLRLLGKHALGS